MNFRFWIFIASIILILSDISTAQNESQYNYKNVSDTADLNELLKEARKHQFSNPDSFIFFLDILSENAEKLKSKTHIMLSDFYKGGFHFGKGEYQKAVSKFQYSLKLSEELKNEKYINYCHLAISSAYMFLSYYPLAQEHMMMALMNFEDKGDFEGAAGVYLNMTFINLDQEDYELADKNSQMAYKYYQKAKNNIGIARAVLNLGEVNFKLKKYNKALAFYRKALHYTKLSNQPSFNGIVYQNIANVFLDQNVLDSAFIYFNKSVEATKEWGNSYSLAECMQGMAKAYAQQNKIKQAIAHSTKSFRIADSANLAEVKADAADQLSVYYLKLGDYKTSLEYKDIASYINDSLFTEKKYKVQNEMEAMYKSQKKEQQIETLSREKEIEVLKNQQSKYYIITLLILLAVIAVVAVLFVRNNRLKAVHKNIELEQRLLRSQMNPHFIFNAVSSIQEFIINKNPLEASSYLSNFAKLMRSILNNSATEFISIDEEIETLEHYLKLQKLRFAEKLEYEIIVDEKLETEELAIPPMLGQPFIENSIKHGIAKKAEGIGKLTIEFREKNSNLILEIRDNGVGLDASNEQKDTNHKSMATQITQNRISNFRKAYKKRVNFEISNVKNDKKEIMGTKVSFELPKEYLDFC